MANTILCGIISDIETSLTKFMGNETIHSTDRSDHLVWGFDDRKNKKTLSIVFSKSYLHGEDKVDYTLEGTGIVFVVPSFWLNVPKPLAIEYLLGIIVDYYSTLGIKYDKEDYERSECNCPWAVTWMPSCADKAYNKK